MHVAITGASSGIGEALVREFVKNGAAVTMVARRRELMEKIAGEVGGRTHIVCADLSRADSALAWLDEAEAALGPIDVLVNNAGVMITEPSDELDPQMMDHLLALDLLTPLALARTMLAKMLARKSGVIVNVASVAALAPAPGLMYYNAAKAGLAAASESLRGELKNTPVRVLTVYPGPIDTALARDNLASVPKTRVVALLPIGNANVLAAKVTRAIAKNRARVIYPCVYAATRHFPALTRFFLDRATPRPHSRNRG